MSPQNECEVICQNQRQPGLCAHKVPSLTSAHAQKGLTLGLMLCCRHLETLNNAGTRDLAFSVCTGPCQLGSLFDCGICVICCVLPGGSDGKKSACSAGDLGSVPGLGRSPEEGNGNPLQYSCLENPMDGGTWQTTVHGVTKSQTQLSD